MDPQRGGLGRGLLACGAASSLLYDAMFVSAGGELGVGAEAIGELSAPAVPAEHGFYDEALRGEVPFSLGFMKPSPNWSFGHAGAFGAPGAGGSLGYADPAAGIAYAYVTNRMGPDPKADPRDRALREALARVVG